MIPWLVRLWWCQGPDCLNSSATCSRGRGLFSVLNVTMFDVKGWQACWQSRDALVPLFECLVFEGPDRVTHATIFFNFPCCRMSRATGNPVYRPNVDPTYDPVPREVALAAHPLARGTAGNGRGFLYLVTKDGHIDLEAERPLTTWRWAQE